MINQCQKPLSKTLATFAALLLMLAPLGASAEEPRGYAPPVMEVSDEQLQKFRAAANTVQEVQMEYAGEIQATQDADKAESLRQEAQDEMVSAVEDAGLSVAEYNLIAQRVQTDPTLADRMRNLESD